MSFDYTDCKPRKQQNVLDTFLVVMLYGAMDAIGLRAPLLLRSVLTVFAFLILFCTEMSAADNILLKVRLVSSTLKIFPDSALHAEPTGAFRITAVRNEYTPFQVAISAKRSIEGVTIVMGGLAGQGGAIDHPSERMLLVETVSVRNPSIPVSINGGQSSLFPAPWPDPLPPLKAFHLEAGRTRAVWVDLFIPADARPGIYRGDVLVSVKDAAPIRLPIELDVRDIAIPSTPSLRTAFGNASLPACLEKVHGVSKGSVQFNKILEEYYWFLIEHRVSPYHIPVDIFSSDARRFLDDPRVTSFVVPMKGGSGKKDQVWDDTEMKRLSDRLEKTGWIEKGFVYLIDEPPPETIPDVIRLGKRIHAINPRLKYLMTPHSAHLLSDKRITEEAEINIWAPLLSVMSSPTERKLLLEEQKKGKELWWYTCVAPKWKGINYFIDDAATAPRIHPWMNCLWGNDGILYWATDNWTQVDCDPWQKTETYPTGNGDGSLLYPGRDDFNHPVASIRLKMLREGLEDYELLRLLAGRLNEAAAKIGGNAQNYRPEKRLFEHAFALVSEEGRRQASGEDTTYLKYLTRDYRDIERQRDIVITEVEQATQYPLLLVDTLPCDGAFTPRNRATVTGYAETGAEVRVNGALVKLRENRFDTAFPLLPGINVLTVTAKNQRNESKTVRRTIYCHGIGVKTGTDRASTERPER